MVSLVLVKIRQDTSRYVDERYMYKLEMAANEAIQLGVRPIFLTPFPRGRDHFPLDRLVSWKRLRAHILHKKQFGSIVLDTTKLLCNKQMDGDYRPELSDDGIHPNERAHGRIATKLLEVLEASFGK